jgi:hypothetical protein
MDFDLKNAIGLGVSGNFAGHLAQAAANIDFGSAPADAPKGLFPVYVPSNTGSFIEAYPISSERLVIPYDGAQIKIEPEIGLLCEISYADGKVSGLSPRFFTTYNDCSLHDKTVTKISEKKNWGSDSKGVSESRIPIDTVSEGGIMDRYRLACYLLRDGALNTFGVDSPVVEYSYFHDKLINWIIEKMNTQQDDGPFESISQLLTNADFPPQAMIGIGATRYNDYGENTFLQAGDESIVVAYDATRYDVAALQELLLDGASQGEGLSILRQVVVTQ